MTDNNDTLTSVSTDAALNKCGPQETVHITLDNQGVPVVDRSSVDVFAGGSVTFLGPSNFEIRFPGSTPCSSKTYSTTCGELALTIRTNACGNPPSYTSYKYDVKVGNKVLDPEIRVHEPV